MERQYVGYLRVSTDRQGLDGLGINAQRDAILKTFGLPIEEFVEVESGKKNNRPELMKAIDYCRDNNCILAIAKIDRLSRNVAFISALMDSGIEFKAADNPHLDKFTIHVLAAVAQHERETIAKRVKDALAVKKKILALEGKRLGCPEVTSTGRTLKDIMLENRKHRSYYQPEKNKVATLVMLKEAGANMEKLIEVAKDLFGKNLSYVTIYSYLKKYKQGELI
jgi:DNA invertase Pin-like site-specific DNA recombinase